jgi:hypothetical protein
MLEAAGHEVSTAVDGEDGLRFAMQYAPAEQQRLKELLRWALASPKTTAAAWLPRPSVRSAPLSSHIVAEAPAQRTVIAPRFSAAAVPYP